MSPRAVRGLMMAQQRRNMGTTMSTNNIQNELIAMPLSVARKHLRAEGFNVPRSNREFIRQLRGVGLRLVKTNQCDVRILSRVDGEYTEPARYGL